MDYLLAKTPFETAETDFGHIPDVRVPLLFVVEGLDIFRIQRVYNTEEINSLMWLFDDLCSNLHHVQ
jgi:hypothetical protein